MSDTARGVCDVSSHLILPLEVVVTVEEAEPQSFSNLLINQVRNHEPRFKLKSVALKDCVLDRLFLKASAKPDTGPLPSSWRPRCLILLRVLSLWLDTTGLIRNLF